MPPCLPGCVMRELARCWQQTRMIVLIALCAALFVSLLIPFKIAVVVPGITEIRPAAALPILFSLLFGPAAAWGAAFGNVIGDFFGTIGPGSFFGFIGNFVYAFVPYRIVRILLKPGESLFSPKGWVVFVFAVILASGLCAVIIALGVDYFTPFPFALVAHAIFINNCSMSLLIVPILFRVLSKRIHQMRLSYDQVLAESDFSRAPLRAVGPFILLLLMVTAYVIRMFAFSPEMKILELAGVVILTVASLLLL